MEVGADKPILVITTGGTIDAQPYTHTPDYTIPLAASIIPKVLETIDYAEQTYCHPFIARDSKDISHDELDSLADFIRQQSQDYIIITHGTDTMPEHARYLKRELAESGKTIMFTGAMVPVMNEITGIGPSDGYENMRFAVKQVLVQQPGVYIAFDQTLYDPEHAVKDHEKKCFYSKFEE